MITKRHFLFLFLLLLLIAVPAQAVVYWVSPTGTNPSCATIAAQGPATTTVAKTTIAAGIACMSSGDTLAIRAGTYAEDITETMLAGKSGSSGFPTTLRAYGTEVVTIRSVSLTADTAGFPGLSFIVFQGDATARNFRIIGTAGEGTVVGIAERYGLGSVHDIKFDGVDMSSQVGSTTGNAGLFTTRSVIGTGNTVHHIWVTNSNIHGATCSTAVGQPGHNFYLGSPYTTIEHSSIYDASGYGIHLIYDHPDHATFRYNRIYNNGTGVTTNCLPFTPQNAWGILLATGDSGGNNEVYANLVYNNMNGIAVSSSNNHVYNNTVYRSGVDFPHGGGDPCCYEAIRADAGTGNAIVNNIIWANQINSIADTGGHVSTNTPNLFTDPSFVSASTGNFALNSGSTAIDAGINLGPSYSPDYAGVARPTSPNPWDIGAYESGGVPPPTVVITRPTSPNCVGTAAACTISGVAGSPNNILNLTGTSTQSGGAVTWACDRCTGTNTASGTLSWTTAQISLKPGVNIITVTHASTGSGIANIAITYVPTFPGNARVLALGFEDGAGTTATDSSGNGNTGTLVGTPTWLANGRYGKALTFNGTSQYVRVPRTNNTLELSQSFTLSAWVNPAASIPRFQAIIHKNSAAESGGPASPYDMYANITGFCGDSGFMGLVTVNGIQTPSQSFSACSAAPLQTNNWTHIAVTYDNAAAQLKLYRNGVLITTTTASGYMENSDLELFIATSEVGEYFAGSIDEVRVYNFAIPVAGALNVTPNGACNSTEANTAATASIIGDMNCPVSPLAPPIAFKIGSASTLKLGADKQLSIGSVPQ